MESMHARERMNVCVCVCVPRTHFSACVELSAQTGTLACVGDKFPLNDDIDDPGALRGTNRLESLDDTICF